MMELLFNPFRRYGGSRAVWIALVIMALAVPVAVLVNVHFDGVIDLHSGPGPRITWWLAAFEWAVAWLFPAVCFYVAGVILSPSSIRFIDVLGTQGMARFPLLLSAPTVLLPAMDKIARQVENFVTPEDARIDLDPMDLAQLIVAVSVMMGCLVWAVALMYKAYSVACNLNGTRAVVSFIVSFLVAEILSKVVYSFVL